METGISVVTRRAENLDQWFARLNRDTDVAAANELRQKNAVRWWEILFRPVGVFLNLYLRRGGFREGAAGFVAAGLGAFCRFTAYAKMWEQLRER